MILENRLDAARGYSELNLYPTRQITIVWGFKKNQTGCLGVQ